MKIFPAIDIYDKKAVRLYKGDYAQMTVYAENPVTVALDFKNAGAKNIHVVDLEGARSGNTDNLLVIKNIVEESGLFVEVGQHQRLVACEFGVVSCGRQITVTEYPVLFSLFHVMYLLLNLLENFI